MSWDSEWALLSSSIVPVMFGMHKSIVELMVASVLNGACGVGAVLPINSTASATISSETQKLLAPIAISWTLV